MSYIDDLARHWQDFDCSFEARTELENGDEVWMHDTYNLGIPVLWVKHNDGSFEYRVIHTHGYNRPTGEHWCLNCHCLVEQHGNFWECPDCKETFSEASVEENTAPTEEACYTITGELDNLQPEPEWEDSYQYDNPYIPKDEYDWEGF